MDNAIVNFYYATVSGVLSAFIVWAFASCWHSMFIPWLERRLYRDIPIAGDWKGYAMQDGVKVEECIELTQSAHKVKGSISNGKNDIYLFEGEFKNLILTARYWDKAQSNLDRGTFTLMLRENGNVFEGFCSLYLDKKNCVISGEYKWKSVKKR